MWYLQCEADILRESLEQLRQIHFSLGRLLMNGRAKTNSFKDLNDKLWLRYSRILPALTRFGFEVSRPLGAPSA